MITAAQISNLLNSGEDYGYAMRLMKNFEALKAERKPIFLKLHDLEEVLKWRLSGRFEQLHSLRSANTDGNIQDITGLALNIMNEDKAYELELKMRILSCLRGVDIHIGSAILALVYPEEYAVLNINGWRQVFWETETVFSILEYKRFLREVRNLAKELKWSVLEVNLAIWEYDKQHYQKKAQ